MLEVIPTVPWLAGDYPIVVAELRSASKELERLLSESERNELIDFLAFHPEGGDVMPCTGGVRKARWPFRDKGKSKGLRVIYYFHDLNMPLYILAVYSKGEILRPTKREEKDMRQLVKTLVRINAERTAAIMAEWNNSA